jgi:hypothetical protein
MLACHLAHLTLPSAVPLASLVAITDYSMGTQRCPCENELALWLLML